ncbi:retropepsin-like aspartic protease [Pedobacter sp. NJ-S-72]
MLKNECPITITDQGHIMVKAKINGVEGNFIFDTGAGLTLVTKKFSAKIKGLSKQDGGYTAFRATGEKLDADLFNASTLSLGTFSEANPVLTIFDVDFGPIDGLVSLMSFKNQVVTVDYEHKKLIFENQKSFTELKKKGKTVALQLSISRDKSLDMFAYFNVNNKLNLQFSIDCGSGQNVFRINSKYMPALGIDSTDTSKVTARYQPSEFNPAVKTRLYSTNIESIAIRDNPAASVTNQKATFVEGLIYDGIVSLNWIGKKITIDVKNSQLIIN